MSDDDLTTRPAYASKQAIIDALLNEAANCPNLYDLAVQIAHTDLNALSDKSTVTKATFGL